MTLFYTFKLGLKTYPINIKAQKIDSFTLKIFEIILNSFWVENKFRKTWFFQKIFLLTNISIKVILKILFLSFSNANIEFA